MKDVLRLAISTCPNDTYAFAGLLEGAVSVEGAKADVTLADVEELNRRWMEGEFDAAKLSYHAALVDAHSLVMLPVGSALGSGNGPLLLASRTEPAKPRPEPVVLCPGRWTTAHLLWQLFHGGEAIALQCVFSDIMPRLVAGEADLGVCIHEGRFTWEQHGLGLVEDLGQRWERETGELLPLGGIAVRRRGGEELGRALASALRASIAWADAHPDEALTVMREHAQELDDDVIRAHVELYVNDHTRALGDEGRRAIETLGRLARERGLVTPDAAPLEVLA